KAACHGCAARAECSQHAEPDAGLAARYGSSSMRRALLRAVVLSTLVVPASVVAQADTGTSTFEINGLRVILRRNTPNDVVSANVYLLGGTQQLSPATQGMEVLLLRASELGTNRFPRESVRQLTAGLGSSVVIDPNEDWTRFGFTTVRANFDSTWA